MALGTTGISTTLVANTIGVGSNDVGTLCTSSKINKWSKKKPVILNQVAPNRSGTWWRGTDGNCGLHINSFTSISSLVTAIKSGETWTYNSPTGGATSPYRIYDFANYEHAAVPILLQDEVTDNFEINKVTLSGGTYPFSLAINAINTDYQLGVPDLPDSIKNAYLAIQIWDTSANAEVITVSSQEAISSIGTGGQTVDVDFSSVAVGNHYEVRFFLSSVIIIPGQGYSGNYYPIYQDTEHPAYRNINVVSYNPVYFGIDITQLSYALNGTYANSDTFFSSPGPEGNRLQTMGAVAMKCTVTNLTTGTKIFYSSDLKAMAYGFNGQEEEVGLTGCLYDSTKTNVTSISVPANSTIDCYIFKNYILNINNGSAYIPSTGIYVNSYINIMHETFQYSAIGNIDFKAVSGTGSIIIDTYNF
jgi:hypothetical protein